MPDIKRTFQYHGAEHKTIFCYESGEALTVENVKKYAEYLISLAEQGIIPEDEEAIKSHQVNIENADGNISKEVIRASKLILAQMIYRYGIDISKISEYNQNVITNTTLSNMHNDKTGESGADYELVSKALDTNETPIKLTPDVISDETKFTSPLESKSIGNIILTNKDNVPYDSGVTKVTDLYNPHIIIKARTNEMEGLLFKGVIVVTIAQTVKET